MDATGNTGDRDVPVHEVCKSDNGGGGVTKIITKMELRGQGQSTSSGRSKWVEGIRAIERKETE